MMESAFNQRLAAVPLGGQGNTVKKVCILPDSERSCSSSPGMVYTAIVACGILQTLRNALRESVIVSRPAPTQCRDTTAPVTLGILSMWMGILVKV